MIVLLTLVLSCISFVLLLSKQTYLLPYLLAGWLAGWLTEVEDNDDDDDDDDDEDDDADGILAYYLITVHIDWWQTLSVKTRVFRQFQSNP